MTNPTSDKQAGYKTTFWELLDAYAIEIPIIQRDYAQGRQDVKTKQIRESFVKDLFEMVANVDKTIDLDFIYGSIIDGKLILLDGQQRMTTLFLLHCYLAAQANALGNNNSDSEPQKTNRKKLGRFTYETRFSSRDFCKALVGNLEQVFSVDITEHSKLSDAIKDASWFWYSWGSDPTIKSMLVMLDEIHQVFKKKVQEEVQEEAKEEAGKGESLWGELWRKLIDESKPPITFQFLEMGEFSLTDELYIKMNARGRPLTDFENFKAWLQGYVAENKKTMVVPDEFWTNFWENIDKDWTDLFWTNFWENIDKDWTDLFWRHRNKFKLKDTHQIDEPYFNFFRGMMLNHYAKEVVESKDENAAETKNNKSEKTFIQLIHDGDYLPTSRIEKEGRINKEILSDISVVLNYLSCRKNDKNKDGIEMLNGYLKGINFFWPKNNKKDGRNDWLTTFCQNPTYPDRVLFYALVCFIVKHDGKIDNEDKKKQLRSWMRVMRNLIRNTPVSAENFTKAIISIGELKESCGDIYGYLSSPEISSTNSNGNGKISFFDKEQVAEEIRKAELINSDLKWEDELLKAENHEYFYGQIKFLIDFAEADDGSDASDLHKFKDYATKASVLFNSKKEGNKDGLIHHSEFLLQRALLCFGNYLIKVDTWNDSFCQSTLKDRNENWRKVFKDKSKYLKSLLDELAVDHEEDGLKAIIGVNNNIQSVNRDLSEQGKGDWQWRQLFIQCPEAIGKCGAKKIRFGADNNVFLLSKSQMNGSHAELYSFEFYTNHIEKEYTGANQPFLPFTNKWYYSVSNSRTQPCAVLDQWKFDDKEIALDISYINQKFQVELFTRGESRNAWPDRLKDEALSKEIFLTKPDSKENYTLKFKDEPKSDRGLLITDIKLEDIESVLASICTVFKKIDEVLQKGLKTAESHDL